MPRVAVIGAGHNGLVCAAYLARAGIDVSVLERRHLVGGACVTEERWPGFRVSRAAYVLGIFRPRIFRELELRRFGVKLLPRSPSSFTPLPDRRSLVLGPDPAANAEEIGHFSKRDAAAYPRYERWLERVALAVEPSLDLPPPDPRLRRPRDLLPWLAALRGAARLGRELPRAARLLLGPASDLLREWFDSEPLRGTLATDAVIGAFASPNTPGTGSVLFHHVMGSVTGTRGVWAYVEGGMGTLAEGLSQAAQAAGARVRTEAPVARVRLRGGRATGVILEDGEEVAADAVVSCADPVRTFGSLVDSAELPEAFARAVAAIDMRSPVVKLNLALEAPPRFRVNDRSSPPLGGTIHIGAVELDALDLAYHEAAGGVVSSRPMVELTIPSTLDATLAPPGRHVASVFAQYAPARSPDDPAWPELRDRMQQRVLAAIDEVAPGFSSSVLELEVLAAPDLEDLFGLSGGNIFHGAMSPDRLAFLRPVPGWSRYRTPIERLYLCGSGTHPGGGVTGACGRNAALEIRADLGTRFRRLSRSTPARIG